MAEEILLSADELARRRDATFERRFRLLELGERREDRLLKQREIELSQGRGIVFTSGQATVAAAIVALLSGVFGGFIQSSATRDVEAGKNSASLTIEKLKAEANIVVEKQKEDSQEHLDRQKFETTLILKAIEAPRREDQIRNLKFFLNASFIRDPDGRIAKMDEGAYPSLPPVSTSSPADLFRDLKGAVGYLNVEGTNKSRERDKYVGTAF